MFFSKNSFRFKFFIVSLSFGIFFATLSIFTNNYYLKKLVLDENEKQIENLMNFILAENPTITTDFIDSLCKKIENMESITSIGLLDDKSNHLYSCKNDDIGKIKTVVKIPENKESVISGKLAGSDYVFFYRAIKYNIETELSKSGFLVFAVDKKILYKSESGLFRIRLILTIIVLTLLVVFTYVATNYLTRPFDNLIKRLNALSNGEIDKISLNDIGYDELVVIVNKLNELLQSLVLVRGDLSIIEEKFSTLIKRTKDIILVLNNNLSILYASPTFKDVIGFDIDKFNEKISLFDLTNEDYKSFLSDLSDRLKRGETIDDSEMIITGKEGNNIYLLTSWIVRNNGDNSGADIILFARDITQLKSVENELKRKSENMETILFSLSHDLKSPIFTLKGMSTLFKQKYYGNLDEQGRHFIDRINENIARMERLISNMLDISRAERQIFKTEEVRLSQLISLLVSDMQEIIKEAGASISIANILPDIYGDRDKIYIVFKNLIENSIKYRSTERSLLIKIYEQENEEGVDVLFEDNGIGIESKYIEKIFKPFSRAVNPSEDFSGGHGIGLSIVKGILDAHKISISVESSYREWTRFKIRIPESIIIKK